MLYQYVTSTNNFHTGTQKLDTTQIFNIQSIHYNNKKDMQTSQVSANIHPP